MRRLKDMVLQTGLALPEHFAGW